MHQITCAFMSQYVYIIANSTEILENSPLKKTQFVTNMPIWDKNIFFVKYGLLLSMVRFALFLSREYILILFRAQIKTIKLLQGSIHAANALNFKLISKF